MLIWDLLNKRITSIHYFISPCLNCFLPQAFMYSSTVQHKCRTKTTTALISRAITPQFLLDFNRCNPQKTIYNYVPWSTNISLSTKMCVSESNLHINITYSVSIYIFVDPFVHVGLVLHIFRPLPVSLHCRVPKENQNKPNNIKAVPLFLCP